MNDPTLADNRPKSRRAIIELALLFLRLGATAFGGPAAHIAMLYDEAVERRKWLGEQEFLDLVGATNLIPGPNSTEMAIHIGFLRGGWIGLLVAGVCFIFPAMTIVLLLAWAYVRYGSSVEAGWLLYGVKPVVIVLITKALWDLGRKALKGAYTASVGAAVFFMYFLGVNEVALLVLGGLFILVVRNVHRLRASDMTAIVPFLPGILPGLTATPFSLGVLFATFLKIGAVLYGSGYVLLAFLRSDFVHRLGWLTDAQLVDAVAVGQLTPGPVFTTATFVGYLLGDTLGALAATAAIFLPSFIFVAVSNPFVPRLRESKWASGFLDGVNAAALGLMAAVTMILGRASLVDVVTIAQALVAGVLVFRLKVNSTWIILGGAVVGLIRLALV